jgi:cation diffusion facilitator CzcD-associated flavoprotein CzcO
MSAENGGGGVADGKRNPRISVIGAGMSGILTAIKLQEAGISDITVHEKADRLGGTWRDNTYPGLSCDVPSHLYSYSFELNPEWSRLFSPGAEIQDYFETVAAKYGVDRYIRYNSEIVSARYDGAARTWHLEDSAGASESADMVIAATGVLHKPVYPDIEGLNDFSGAMFHSARWDHTVGLDDVRIGIIGTGSTAIQIVPAVIDRVRHLSLFQRTAQWIFPQANPYYSEEDKENFRRNHTVMEHMHKVMSDRFANTFARAVIGDEEQIRVISDACLQNLEDNVRDPELKERLRPDYQAACKRLIMSDDFYPAIQKPNAELVTAKIERIEEAGVRTTDGRLHELDVLVLATGFDGHNFMRPMTVTGQDGQTLDEVWAEANRAYRSVAMPRFPNFFMLVGPNSPIGNFSLIEISEWQLSYIMQLIELYRDSKADAIAPRQDASDAFNARVQEAMKGTVWVSGCSSWYLDKNGNPAMWPFSFEQFCEDMSAPNLNEFELTA